MKMCKRMSFSHAIDYLKGSWKDDEEHEGVCHGTEDEYALREVGGVVEKCCLEAGFDVKMSS